MNARILRRPSPVVAGAALVAGCLAMVSAGCGTSSNAPESGGPTAAPGVPAKGSAAATPEPAGPTKAKVAYLGLTCEAAMFVAYEKGFFKEENLDVEFVKTDWDGLRDGLGLGRFDANYTLAMYLLKPIEQGLDVKITGGVHTGCLRIQASPKTSIKTVADLRGKKIGAPTHLGSPPFLFASRVLAANGIDPKKDVEWVVLAPDVMGLALSNGQVDAVATSEPLGTILMAKLKLRTIADQAVNAPYKDEYCCVTVVSGQLAKRDPATAAKLTRGLLKGARWVSENPTAAAALSVEKKYVAASTDINAAALSKLNYMPGISRCRSSLDLAAQQLKTAGLLNPSTDPADLAKRAWLDLDGVTDAWIEGLKVERVAGGRRPPRLDLIALDELDGLFGAKMSCCDGDTLAASGDRGRDDASH